MSKQLHRQRLLGCVQATSGGKFTRKQVRRERIKERSYTQGYAQINVSNGQWSFVKNRMSNGYLVQKRSKSLQAVFHWWGGGGGEVASNIFYCVSKNYKQKLTQKMEVGISLILESQTSIAYMVQVFQPLEI